VKLNIGAGNTRIEGFDPIDIKRGHDAACLNVPDGSVEEIRASHILEHFPASQVLQVLEGWTRALKPGGIIRIAVPDVDKLIACRQNNPAFDIQPFLMGGQTDEHDFHYSSFTRDTLTALMQEAGLVNIQDWHSEIDDCAKLPISLNLQGTKPDGRSVKILAVESVPRFGPILHASCCFSALLPLGINVDHLSGAFWGQCLTRQIESALAKNPDYILTLDYDTIFKPWHVIALLDLMQRNPQIDALCPMQYNRDLKHIIAGIKDEHGNDVVTWDEATLLQETMPLAFGHFGLTFLRASAFAKMPKPWFIAKPDSDGGWGDGRTDEDVHFWQQWRNCGNTLHMANRVPVGHMVELVAWPNRNLKPVYQTIGDFQQNGMPKSTWI
jgi:hypothetical protein